MKMIALLCAFASSLLAEAPPEWSKLASRIPILGAGAVTHDSPPVGFGHMDGFLERDEREAVMEFWKLASATEEDALLQIVESTDPKVRTLALSALYLQRNPKRLPDLAKFVGDGAPTFPRLGESSAMPIIEGGAKTAREQYGLQQQTVGDFASAFVGAYLSASGSRISFEDYWSARKERKHCVGWFKVALDQATQGLITPPLSAERAARVRKIRAEIDALDRPYRAWTLISLAAPSPLDDQDAGPAVLATTRELVEAAGDIPRDDVLKLMECKLRLDEPDLDFFGESAPFGYAHHVSFFLARGAGIFRPQDADRLLEFEKLHRARSENGESPHVVSPWWAICAAEVAPDRAGEILGAVMVRFAEGKEPEDQDDRCAIAEAMIRLQGTKAYPNVLNWFFNEVPDRTAFGFGRHRFARWLGASREHGLLKKIFADARLIDLDRTTLQYLGKSINDLARSRSTVSQDSIRSLDTFFFDGTMSGMPKVKATKAVALRGELAKWRKRLDALAL